MSNYPHWNPERFVFTLAVTGLLIALWGCGMAAYHIQHPIFHKDAHTVDAQFLNAWERSIDEEYFRNSLPSVEVRYAIPSDGEDVIGETFCNLSPVSAMPTSCRIYITPKYNLAQATAVETLIHEMSHVACYDELVDHGPCFQGTMLRLAKEGAFKGIW